MKKSVSVIILAAGNSSRMKCPKVFLSFDKGRTFLEKIIDSYIAAGIDDIILLINEDVQKKIEKMLIDNYGDKEIKLIVNHFPERGRFYSIRLGLMQSETIFYFIQNIDNPFISASLLNRMIGISDKGNYVVPVFNNKKGHPVLLDKSIKKHILSCESGNGNLRLLLNGFNKIELAWRDEGILANINTQLEYEKYFSQEMKKKIFQAI